MNDSNEDDFFLDASSIWQWEQDHFSPALQCSGFYEHLHHYLSFFYLLGGHRPFISKEKAAIDPDKQAYYQNYLKRSAIQAKWQQYYFQWGSGFYDMTASCPIEKGSVTPQTFATLFALHLRQYEADEATLSRFLAFHYKHSFCCDREVYAVFLKGLSVHSDLLSPLMLGKLTFWSSSLGELTTHQESSADNGANDNEAVLRARKASLALFAGDGLVPPVLEPADEEPEGDTEEEEMPASTHFVLPGPIENKGAWTDEEIQHFFSFLYKPRPDEEGCYLPKEAVDALLLGGIVVPGEALVDPYRLNTSLRYPRKIVDHFIHAFIKGFNSGEKRRLLQFFGSYIAEYSGALDKTGYRSLSKNTTGEKSKVPARKQQFNLLQYMPERFHRHQR